MNEIGSHRSGFHGHKPMRVVEGDIDWRLIPLEEQISQGKRLHNHGKSPVSMGKSIINGDFQ